MESFRISIRDSPHPARRATQTTGTELDLAGPVGTGLDDSYVIKPMCLCGQDSSIVTEVPFTDQRRAVARRFFQITGDGDFRFWKATR